MALYFTRIRNRGFTNLANQLLKHIMKTQIRKLILTGITCIFCLSASFAQTTIKEITDKFFSTYATDPAKAVDYGFSTNKWIDIKMEDIVNLKSNLKKMVDLCGDFHGYEMISEKTAGENVKMINYVVRHDREPLVFMFLFYRPNGSWRLYNFSYTENLEADLK